MRCFAFTYSMPVRDCEGRFLDWTVKTVKVHGEDEHRATRRFFDIMGRILKGNLSDLAVRHVRQVKV